MTNQYTVNKKLEIGSDIILTKGRQPKIKSMFWRRVTVISMNNNMYFELIIDLNLSALIINHSSSCVLCAAHHSKTAAVAQVRTLDSSVNCDLSADQL